METELRWPEGAGDPMEVRTYLFLRDAGPAPAGAPEFQVIVRLRRNGLDPKYYRKIEYVHGISTTDILERIRKRSS